MKNRSRSVGFIAKLKNVSKDDLLIILWERPNGKFDYISDENIPIRKKHFSTVIKAAQNLDRENYLNDKGVKTTNKVSKNYDFSKVGHQLDEMRFLKIEHVLEIHDELAKEQDGVLDPISPAGVKNEHLLESALLHPCTMYGGTYKYPTLESAAAALMFSMTSNHPFHNGNKRTALMSMIIFLNNHKIRILSDDSNLYKMARRITMHAFSKERTKDAEIYALAQWVVANSKKINNSGERSIPKRDFLKILKAFGCEYSERNKYIERKISKEKTNWYSSKSKTLRYPFDMSSIRDGQEIDKRVVGSIRKKLELDSKNGMSDEMFYNKIELPICYFVQKHRNVLNRLAKV